MKNKTISLLSGAFAAEAALLVMAAGFNKPTVYIIQGVLAALGAVTVFFLVKQLAAALKECESKSIEHIAKLEKKNGELEDKLRSAISVQESVSKTFDDFCNTTVSYIDRLQKTQAQYEEENAHRLNAYEEKTGSMIQQIAEKNGGLLTEINAHNEELFAAANKQNSELITALGEKNAEMISRVIQHSREETAKITQANRESVQQLTAAVSESVKMSEDSITGLAKQNNSALLKCCEDMNSALNKQMQMAQKQLCDLERQNGETVADGMKIQQRLMEDFSSSSEKKLAQMNDVYGKLLDEIHSEISESYERVSRGFKDSVTEASAELGRHTSELTDSLAKHTLENAESMSNSCHETVENAAKLLTEKNRTLLNEQLEQFRQRLHELESEYEKILGKHTNSLAEQTEDSIRGFVEAADKVFSDNARKTGSLVETEKQLIDELTEHNTGLRQLLENSLKQYKDTAGEMISSLEKKISECIDGEEKVGNEQIEKLSKALSGYSDSFVERSAQAVAREVQLIQKDNDERIAGMADKIENFAQTEKSFAEECGRRIVETDKSIQTMIAQNNDFIEKLRSVSGESVGDLDEILKKHLLKLMSGIDELNKANSQAFSNAMEDYRSRFVQASAEAVAGVQHDNLSAIDEAHRKLIELEELVKRTNNQCIALSNDISRTLGETKKAIEGGNDTTKEQYDNFFDDITNVLKTKLGEYNESSGQMMDAIIKLQKSVEHNTESYHSTLKQINDSQNAMNSLTKKDIEVLERLAKR